MGTTFTVRPAPRSNIRGAGGTGIRPRRARFRPAALTQCGMNAEIGLRGKITSQSATKAAIGVEQILIVVYLHAPVGSGGRGGSMPRTLFAFVFIFLATHAQAEDVAGHYEVLGVGNATCKDYLIRRNPNPYEQMYA